MRKLIVFMFVAMSAFAFNANAEIGGKKVIFIHGNQPAAFDRDITQAEREANARAQAGDILGSVIDHYIFYESAIRLGAQNNALRAQINTITATGDCVQGCLIISYSTGDLFTRHILTRLNQWQIDTQRFRILATFDMAGAGGGTELADLAASIVANPFLQLPADLIADIFFDADVDSVEDIGIVNDLRPSIARSIGIVSTSVPRLRVATADGNILSSGLISGNDDGVIPMHSSCGSSRAESIDSCSRSIEADGRLRSADGPRSFLSNHFPIIMAEDVSHTAFADNDRSGTLVAVNNNRSFNGVNINLNERSFSTGFWIFKRYFRTIDKPRSQSLAAYLVSEID